MQEVTSIPKITMDFSILSVEKKSFSFSQTISDQNGQLLFEGIIFAVYANVVEKKSKEIPKELLEKALSICPKNITPSFHIPTPQPYHKCSISLLKSKYSNTFPKFSFPFTILKSHQDWWGHTNHSIYIQLFEDVRHFAFQNFFFKDKLIHGLAGQRLYSIHSEYKMQTYTGDNVVVVLWPLLDYDFNESRPNLTEMSADELLNHVIGFGAQLEIVNGDETGEKIACLAFLNVKQTKSKL